MSAPRLKAGPSGIYYVHWTEQGRSKRVSTGTQSLAAAKTFLGTWLLMEREDPAQGRTLPVADLWDAYHKAHAKKLAASRTAEFCWQNLEKHFGALTPPQISNAVVEDYLARRLSGRIGRPSQASTVRRELVVLTAVLNWHVKRHTLAPTAVPIINLPPNGPARERWLTVDEKRRLFAAAEELRGGPTLSRVERFLWLAYETGARRAAILELTWAQVDFGSGMIALNPEGRQQTKKRRPNVPMSAALRPVLERAYRERTDDRVVGTFNVNAVLRTVCTKAGLEPITAHVLRHTTATHLARAGVPLFDVAGVLGNSVAMVEKVYAKHTAEAAKSALDRLAKLG